MEMIKPFRSKRKYAMVFCQKWEESERGWWRRPDGYSLHVTENDAKNYIRGYWDSMPDEVPDEYSCPDGKLYTCLVNKKTLQDIQKSKNGIRDFGRSSPTPFLMSDEEVGGWIPLKGGGHGKR